MRRCFLPALGLIVFFGMVRPALSAPTALHQAANGEIQITAVINGPNDIKAGKTLILDGSASHVTGEQTSYRWTIDETKRFIGQNVVAIFTPEKPGKLTFRLTVRSLDLNGQMEETGAVHPVVAYNRKIVLIAENSVPADSLDRLTKAAMENGVYIRTVQAGPVSSSLNQEDQLLEKLTDEKEIFSGADSIVVWGNGIEGLQALMRSIDSDSDRQTAVRFQSIVLITDHNLSMVARSAKSAFNLLNPAQLIVTRKNALNNLIEVPTINDFLPTLEQHNIPVMVLTASTVRNLPWDIFSMLINFLLSHGVSGQTVTLLLMLPVIATIFAFLKQVVGITTFGLYTPSIVALSFLVLGWKIGVLFLLFILFSGYLTRELMQRWRLLYIPKVAIILTVVCFTLLLLIGIGTFFGVNFSRDTVFILLILSTLAENFINLKTEEGWLSAFLAVGETILGALFCVFIVQWPFFQTLILAYPELILITIAINVLLGRWTGLRLIEYFRFHELIKHLQEEE